MYPNLFRSPGRIFLWVKSCLLYRHVGLAASSIVNAPLHHVSQSDNSVNNWREVRTASEIKQSLPNLDWCQRIPGLVEHQLALCRRSPNVFRKVTGAAQLAIHECQAQFRGERWNCTTVNDSTVFGRTAVKGPYFQDTSKCMKKFFNLA